VRQVIILITLLAILTATTELSARAEIGAPLDAITLTTTGFIVLAAYAFGELFRRMRLPALLGYLAAGMLFGPSFSAVLFEDAGVAPINEGALGQLELINMLAVGVIGTMGGGEIRLSDLRESFKKIATITIAVFVLVLPLVTGLVLALSFAVPTLVPFLIDVPNEAKVAAALLLGALAVGMSPAATLALLLEVRAQGRFTSLVLGIVVLADLVLVATFLLALAFAKLLISPEGFSTARLLEALPVIGAEFGWAILLGLFVGLAFIAYLRLVRRELLLFSLGIIFVTSFVASRLHAETLLAFLVGGFVVQNFSKHGHTLIEAFEDIALPVFVIYFTTQAANLDLVSFTVYLPLTLILVATRVGLFYFGVGAGAKLAKIEDKERRQLRISFFSQGGVDLVLAAMVAQAIPGWGADVQTVTMATILIYIVVGPPLLARALDDAGESAAARERGAETLEARRGQRRVAQRELAFGTLETANRVLDERLVALRGLMERTLEGTVRETVVARSEHRRTMMTSLAHTITTALDPEAAIDGSGRIDHEVLRSRLNRLHAEVARVSAHWNTPEIAPLEPSVLQETFDELATAEPFASAYRVVREPSLFEPRGGRVQRLIRFGRRLRRSVLGPGVRTVPLGRLWRYHVALDIPVAFWSVARAEESETWARLVIHYRATWQTLEDLLAGRRPKNDGAAMRSMSMSGTHPAATSQHDGELEVVEVSETAWSPVQGLTDARQAAEEREELLVSLIENNDAHLEEELGAALCGAWTAFLSSVEVVGTLEHASWRYRVSARYDAAQAATAELRERLGRDLRIAAGVRDHATAVAHACELARGARDAASAIARELDEELSPLGPELERALELCPRLADDASPEDLEEAGHSLAGLLENAATKLDAVSNRMNRPETLREHRFGLSRGLISVPEVVSPSPTAALRPGAERDDKRHEIRLRTWLRQTLVRGLTVALLDEEAEVGRRLSSITVSVHHARQVLDYHMLTIQGGPEQIDRGAADRLSGLIERVRADLGEVVRVAEDGLMSRVEEAIGSSLPLVLEGRWEEVARRLRRLDDGTVSRAAVAEWIRTRWRGLIERLRSGVRNFADEVVAVFVEHSTPASVAAYRELLFGKRTSMTEAYERLFTTVPAESVGLVVDRIEAEPLEAAIERWAKGRGGPILVRGDRGIGKRTLVRQVLAQMSDTLEASWLSLSPSLERESRVAAELAVLMGQRPADDFRTLERRARKGPSSDGKSSKKAIVVENAERLFRRTPEGLRRIRHFFDLVSATSRDVAWIVLLAEPAARLLDPALELGGRFPATVTMRPMTTTELQQVLTLRHRLSGYELDFDHHAPTLHEWIRSPKTAWRTKRGTGDAMYERVHALSHGNVRQALRLWLAAARVDDRDDNQIVVGPIDAVPEALLGELPLVSRVLLASLLLHGPLRLGELGELALRGGRGLEAEVTRLAHLGLIVVRSNGDDDPLVEVRTRLVAPLTEELRACNML
jgi:Kef-type K+ transport system membrane component KefB